MTENRHGRLSPEMLAHCMDAFEEAWKALVDGQDARVLNHTLTREAVAKRIVQSALTGQHDLAELIAVGIA
jgi:hypothetical protein